MIKIEQKIVGSYHKTGTVLLEQIFAKYCAKTKEKIIFAQNFFKIKKESLINNKSIAVVRHPYEIIVSGWRYHLQGKEDWLHNFFF